MYKRGVIMTTFEIVVISVLSTLFIPSALIFGIGFIIDAFKNDVDSFYIVYKDELGHKETISNVKKIKYLKGSNSSKMIIKYYSNSDKRNKILYINERDFILGRKIYD